MSYKSILLYPILSLLLLSCGSISKLSLSVTSDIFYDASFAVETEKNWDLFEDAVASNVKLLESIYYLDPSNLKMSSALIKAYAGMAFVVYETLYLNDVYRDRENTIYYIKTLKAYSRAATYGEKYLNLRGITYDSIMKSLNKEGGLKGFLSSKLSNNKIDLEAVLFMGQAIAALVNLQRDKMYMVAQLPVAKGMFDWVCSIEPDINHGACLLFYGAYESARPKMLGGNAKKGKEYFLKMIKKWPENYLARSSFLQYYAIPLLDENEFKRQSFYLKKGRDKFEKSEIWRPATKFSKLTNDKMKKVDESMNIYKAVGLKRFQIMQKYKKSFF